MASFKKKIEITLSLTEAEAEYLLGLLQNYFGEPGAENPADNALRCDIFHALKRALEF